MSQAKTIQNFAANAKLMITGEYLVLKGAESLSLPLKPSQTLQVKEHQGIPSLSWKTIVKGQHWFEAVFSLDEFVIGNTDDFPTAQNLREILQAAKNLNPAFLSKRIKFEANSKLDFEVVWGLGSSSSLIVNIAKWAEIDAFELFSKVSSGSGYDIAAASSDSPIVYRYNQGVREIRKLDFYPDFHDHLYFAYLGKKRNSAQAVNSFSKMADRDLSSQITEINAITQAMVSTSELRNFRRCMRDHERIISGIIGIPPIGTKIFSDFSGDVKSLGAWGGDFMMLATDMPRDYVISWLRKKDLNIWFSYEDLVLKPVTAPNLNI
jgi:mevalonate kinase